MSKQSLLLVDGDTRSLRVLEVSLRKSGFTVTTAISVQDALDKLEVTPPDLIVSETAFQDGDGFELRRRVRSHTEWSEIPFIFLTAELAIENKIKGLELGVDDYLTKPIYIKEIITRINILLQKRQRARFEERRDGRTRFAGRVSDMPVVDVIQTIEVSRKSGVIQFTAERGRNATIYFRDGKVIDAEAGTLLGEDAVYRLLTWSEGEFEVVFRTVRRREVILTSSQGLLMEGMRRLDEWSRLLEQLPTLSHRFEVDAAELATRLGDVPDDNNRILRLLDGKRTLLEVIDASDVGDLECLQAISKLYFEDLLIDLDHGAPTRRDTGKSMPLVEVEAPTPIEESASGPTRARADSGERAIASDASQAFAERAPTPPPVAEEDLAAESGPSAAAAPEADEAPEANEPEHESAEPGPLLGGYRPSSLRLIDEAVAAAEAIEPSLFEGEHDDLSRLTASAVPAPVDDDGAGTDAPEIEFERREDTNPKMIGSLGRDRAEASGEVLPPPVEPAPAPITQRELITIMPRRQTREIPMPATAEPPAASPVEPPHTAALPPRSVAELAAPKSRGPNAATIFLMAVAVVLSAIAVFMWVSKHRDRQRDKHENHVVAVVQDGPELLAPADGPELVAIAPDSAATPAGVLPDARPPADARPSIDAAMPVDAPVDARVVVDARSLVDAGSGPPTDAEIAKVDLVAQSNLMLKQSRDALDENDAQAALEFADKALAFRKVPKAYVARAQALERLGRIDEAIDAIDLAIDIGKRSGTEYAAGWATRGRILWNARRKDEARAAFLHYLELDDKDTAKVRKFLDEPR